MLTVLSLQEDRRCSKCDNGGCGEVVSTVLFSMFCVVENLFGASFGTYYIMNKSG